MKIRIFYLALLTGLFFILVPPTIADAATYYVATTGSDSTSCGGSTAPCRTITYAYGKVVAGDTIIVRNGTYTNHTANWALDLNKSGSPTQPITIRAENKWGAILDGEDNFASRYCATLRGTYNVLDGFDCVDAATSGIVVVGDNNQILNNRARSSGTNTDPASVFGSSGFDEDDSAVNNLFRNNVAFDNGRTSCTSGGQPVTCIGDHGFYVRAGSSTYVNNIAYSNGSGYGFHIYDNSAVLTSLKIFNNVAYSNGKSGFLIAITINGNVEVKNNIAFSNGTITDTFQSGHGIAIGSQCDGGTVNLGSNISFGNKTLAFTNSGTCTFNNVNLIQDNPDFVNPANGNFQLQLGSPAIGAGLPLTAASPDALDVSRPQPVGGAYDIGAYEFVSGGGGPTSTPTPTPGVANTPTPTPAGGADITTGLISHWKFDGTTQDSAGTNHGTFNGGTPSYIAGKLGQALSFDHLDDEVDITDYNPNGADFSVGGWMLMPDNASSDPEPIIGNSQNNPMLSYDGGGRRVQTFIQDATGSETITWTLPSSSPLDGTGWHHVFLVARDASANEVEAYVDGVSLGAQAMTWSYTHNNGSFRKIGRDSGSTFNGSLDDIRLYNRALPGTDIQALYALGSSPTPTPTSGPSACHTHDNTQATPAGFAASYNPFTAQKELLLTAECNASNTTVTLGNGNMGNPTNWDGRMWVWSNGYQLINNTWQSTTYTCSGEQISVSSGTWCRAQATGTLDAQATAYLGYTCQWHAASSSYKCGCADTACTTPLWHAQQIQ